MTTRRADSRTMALIAHLYASQARIAARLGAIYRSRPPAIIDEATERGVSKIAVELWLGGIPIAGYDDPESAVRCRALWAARKALDRIATQGRYDAALLERLGTQSAEPPSERALAAAARVDAMPDTAREIVWMVSEAGILPTAHRLERRESTVRYHMRYASALVAETFGDPAPLAAHRATNARRARLAQRRRMGL